MLKEYLTLPFLAGFKCSCCGKCCRNDWTILLDKHTKDKFERAEKSSDLLARAKDAFMEIPERKGLFSEHTLRIHSGKGCSFLDATNQCAVHKELGPDFTSITCRIYPRLIYLTDRGRELALKMSCPAVVDICADYDGELKVTEHCLKNNTDDNLCATNHLKNLDESNQINKKYYFLLEEFLLKIFARENCTTGQKVHLVGLFIENFIGEFGDINYINNARDRINNCFKRINSLTPIGNHRSDEARALELFILKNFFDKAVINKQGPMNGFTRTVRDFFCTLGFDGISNSWFGEKELEQCFQVHNKILSSTERWDLADQKDLINILVRNCLANFIFSKYFYTFDLIQAYILLVLFFCNIRLYSVAFAYLGKAKLDIGSVKEVVSIVFTELYNDESFLREFALRFMELCNNDSSKVFELAYSLV